MNLKYLQMRTVLAGLKLLPPAVRDNAIRANVQTWLDSVDLGLGPALGLIGDVLPSDAGVQSSWLTFKEELWRWWRDGGGR